MPFRCTTEWKTKEKKNCDKYFDIARGLTLLCDKKMTVIPIVTGALWTIPKGLIREWESWKSGAEQRASKLQHHLDRPELLEESKGFEETCYLSGSNKRKSAQIWSENLTMRNNNNNTNNNNNNGVIYFTELVVFMICVIDLKIIFKISPPYSRFISRNFIYVL